jgi:hypothetical protein
MFQPKLRHLQAQIVKHIEKDTIRIITVELHLSERCLTGSPIIRLSLTPQENLSRIPQN